MRGHDDENSGIYERERARLTMSGERPMSVGTQHGHGLASGRQRGRMTSIWQRHDLVAPGREHFVAQRPVGVMMEALDGWTSVYAIW